MPRRFRGTSIAIGAALLLIAASLLAACDAARPSPSSSPTPAPSAGSTPGASPRLPTPVPTAVVTPAPSPTADPEGTVPPPATDLVIRVTTCNETCGPVPGTVLLEDGLVIWDDDRGLALQSQLTDNGFEAVRQAIRDVGALDDSASYEPTLKPGRDPLDHGVVGGINSSSARATIESSCR